MPDEPDSQFKNPPGSHEHWEAVHGARDDTRVSWYQAEPELSLEMIRRAGLSESDAVIDVGGGSSMLAGRMLDLGFRDITVLDIAATALDRNRLRLGKRAEAITWICADIRHFQLTPRYDLWHDRALFHFMTKEADRTAYLQSLRQALKRGGQVIMATFALGGPLKCSGLEIVQYDQNKLVRELGRDFELCEWQEESHRTPSGKPQTFGWYRLRRI